MHLQAPVGVVLVAEAVQAAVGAVVRVAARRWAAPVVRVNMVAVAGVMVIGAAVAAIIMAEAPVAPVVRVAAGVARPVVVAPAR